MTRFLTMAGAAMLLALACGCGQPAKSGSTEASVKAITEDMARWKTEFNSKDLEKILAHYADSTIVVVPGMPAAKSAEGRRAIIKEIIGDPAFSMPSLECPRVEVAKSDDMGFAQCTYVMNMTDPVTKKPITDKGNVVEVYQKQPDGSWKTISDTAVSELPPPVPPPAKPAK